MATLKITWTENDTPGGAGGTRLEINIDGKHPPRANNDVWPPAELEDARRLIIEQVKQMKLDNKPSQLPTV